MRLCFVGLALLPLLLGMEGAPPGAKPDKPAKPAHSSTFSKQIVPILAKNCSHCHGGLKPKGGLDFDAFRDETTVLKNRATWEKVWERVRAGEMPPKGRPKMKDEERRLLLVWIENTFAAADRSMDPGRVTLRRLNRVEYTNTIRDLIGVSFQAADNFPFDDVGYGFDNIGDVLSLPPILLEKYLAAADQIVDRALKDSATRKRILFIEPLTPPLSPKERGQGEGKANDKNKTEATRQILERFAARAYRRPVKKEELGRLLRLVDMVEQDGDTWETGLRLALQAVLVSPHFLFRVELDANSRNAKAVHPVNDFELASRLSYFLWSSMPDDELFEQAKKGMLRKNILAQTRRMLADPKSQGLVENLAGQWLQTRTLKTITPDPGHYPSFDGLLRQAMIQETELFFAAMLKEDRSVLDFLDADFTFVNERLAKHYNIPDVKGKEFRRVKLTGEQRGGVLTQASVLTVTSNPTRTSPVKRGKWILENVLGTPPPPPPPGAGELKEDKEVVLSGSLRKRMELHRAKPDCAVCHERMDPLGFALENYDGIGGWRTKDGTFDIDAAGVLPGGQSFKGPAELRALLKGKSKEFCRCLAEKMLTYALGRGLEAYDRPAVERICKELAQNNFKLTRMIEAIVQSEPFQLRRGEEAK